MYLRCLVCTAVYLRCAQAAVLQQYRCVFAMSELTRCVFAMLGPLCLKLPPEPNNYQKTQNPCAPAALPPGGPVYCRGAGPTTRRTYRLSLLNFKSLCMSYFLFESTQFPMWGFTFSSSNFPAPIEALPSAQRLSHLHGIFRLVCLSDF